MDSAACAVTESTGFRFARRCASLIAILAAGLLLAGGVANAVSPSASHRLPNLLLVLAAGALLGCCAAAYRRPSALRMPTVFASMAVLLALSFSDVGRSLLPGKYTVFFLSGAAPAAMAAVIAVLCVQISGKLAQRHACSCD